MESGKKSASVFTPALIQQSPEIYRALVDGVTGYAVYLLDPEGSVVTWSPGAARLYGYAFEEIVGQNFSCFYPPDDVKSGLPARELTLAASRGSFEDEGWRLRKNGGRFWAHSVFSSIRKDDVLRGFAKVVCDASAGRQSERMLRSVVDHASLGVISTDEDGVIQSLTPAAQQLFGYSEAEVVDKHIRALIIDPDGKRPEPHLLGDQAGGPTDAHGVQGELLGRRKDGSEFPLRMSVTGFAFNNRRYCMRLVQDLSERKNLEEQLRQSQKMDVLGQMAFGIAHDLNNLLTIISGYCEMLHDKARLDVESQEMLTDVRQASDRASALIHRVLAFSRNQTPRPRTLNLNDLVIDLQRMLHRMIGEDVALSSNLSPALSLIHGDAGLIEQVLFNLAVNARDAMPDGGKLTIETRNVTVDGADRNEKADLAPGRYAMLAVTDTGQGMPAKVQARAFEAFFTTKPPGKGTGLGLATVQGIVRQSQGHIRVESQAGQGTTFRIYFPAVKGQAEPAPRSAAIGENTFGSETILVVEDEPGVRRLARLALETFGYTVLEAKDSREAMSLVALHGERIQLVVIDVVMPGVSGRQLFDFLYTQPCPPRILFVTGYADALSRLGDINASHLVLHKPFTPAILAGKVREILDRTL